MQNLVRFLTSLLVVGCIRTSASPVDHWQLRSPLPTGSEIVDMTFGNGTFVGVGYGPIMTSTNGVNWEAQNVLGPIWNITYGKGLFVAGPLSRNVLVSADGVHWAKFAAPLRVQGIDYGQGVFLAAGIDSSGGYGVMYSADATNWTRSATLVSPGDLSGTVCGDGRYLVANWAGDIYVSTNLTDWSSTSGSSDAINSICYANGLYVAVGNFRGVLVSADATHWTNVGSSSYRIRVKFCDGKFVAVGDDSAIVSSDGTNWTTVTLPEPLNISIIYHALAYGNDVFAAAGTRGQFSTSPDATNWTSQFHGTVEDLYGVAFGSNQWICVGNLGETITSTNGMDWVTRRSQYPGTLTAVSYANGIYIAADYFQGYGEVWVSSNLSTWTEHYPAPAPAPYALAFGNGRWVGVGLSGVIWGSTNGADWQIQPWGYGPDLTGVVFAQQKFVAVGDKGLLMNSSDGISWATNVSPTTNHLNGLVYAQGRFLAVGDHGTIIRSTDGIHWTTSNLNLPVTFTSIAYGDGYFVAVGLGGEILTSSDSWNWMVQNSPSDLPLLSVAYGDHSFLAAGLGGAIVQSDAFVYVDIVKTNIPVLSLTGPANRLVSIETISNLGAGACWNDTATIALTNQPTLWRDLPPSASNRFYRVRLLQ